MRDPLHIILVDLNDLSQMLSCLLLDRRRGFLIAVCNRLTLADASTRDVIGLLGHVLSGLLPRYETERDSGGLC